MFELLLDLLDRLIKLKNVQASRDRELFSDHIEPIYQDMTKVIQEYRNTLYQLEDSIRSDDATIDEIIQDLKIKRRKYAPLRQKLDQYSSVLSGAPELRNQVEESVEFEDVVEEFAMHCFEVLNIEPFGPRAKTSSIYTTLITDLKYIEELQGFSRDRSDWDKPSKTFFGLALENKTPQIVIDEYSNAIDKGWELVTGSYIKSRTKLLSSK